MKADLLSLVPRDNHRLEGEDVPAFGIYRDLDPVDVGAAESLNPGEVLQQVRLIEQGFVHLEEVGISVHEHHRAIERLGLGYQGRKKVTVSVETGQRALILCRLWEVEAGISLDDEHNCQGFVCLGYLEGFMHPFDVGCVACSVLGVVRGVRPLPRGVRFSVKLLISTVWC